MPFKTLLESDYNIFRKNWNLCDLWLIRRQKGHLVSKNFRLNQNSIVWHLGQSDLHHLSVIVYVESRLPPPHTPPIKSLLLFLDQHLVPLSAPACRCLVSRLLSNISRQKHFGCWLACLPSCYWKCENVSRQVKKLPSYRAASHRRSTGGVDSFIQLQWLTSGHYWRKKKSKRSF